MKTKIATALSVIGVLGAGSAAALVNTQILDSGPAESGASAAVLPPATPVDITVPEVDLQTLLPTEPVELQPSDPTTPPTTAEPAPATVAPSGFLTAFNVGEAGVVTVDVVDGRLVLVSAEPKAGWEVTSASEDDEQNHVDVEFVSDTVRVEFEASFTDGAIVPHVESKSIAVTAASGASAGTGGATATPPPAAPTTTVGHDDDEYDDHGSDDHEYDDHESDDHGGERDDD
jgi:hypothetical protein